MKEPFLLRAESLLEVESQRSRGSDSSGKKPLVRSTGDCSKPMPLTRPMLLLLAMLIGDSVGFWIGLCLLLTFPEVISWLTSNCKYEGGVESEEKKRKMMRRGIEKRKKNILGDWWKWLLMTIWLMIYGTKVQKIMTFSWIAESAETYYIYVKKMLSLTCRLLQRNFECTCRRNSR